MKALLLILAIFGIPCVVRSEEFDWRPVTQLRAVIEDVELVTKTGTRKATGIIVTGLVSADQFKSKDTHNARQPYLEDAELDPTDLNIERQEIPIGTSRSDLPPWTTVELSTIGQALDDAESFDPDIVPDSHIDTVFTMPLPHRTGSWSKSVAHPELKGSLKLFRIIDFSAIPGHYYRYRVRIEYRNPGYQKDDDPFVAAGPTRSTPWSVPSPAVKLQRTTAKSSLDVITFRMGTLVIRDNSIQYPFKIGKLIAVLGKPDRKVENYDKSRILNIWDNLGIVAFQKVSDDLVSSLNVVFITLPTDLSAKSPYGGSIELDKGMFDSSADAETLQAAGLSPDVNFPESYQAETDECFLSAGHSGGILSMFSINWKVPK